MQESSFGTPLKGKEEFPSVIQKAALGAGGGTRTYVATMDTAAYASRASFVTKEHR